MNRIFVLLFKPIRPIVPLVCSCFSKLLVILVKAVFCPAVKAFGLLFCVLLLYFKSSLAVKLCKLVIGERSAQIVKFRVVGACAVLTARVKKSLRYGVESSG